MNRAVLVLGSLGGLTLVGIIIYYLSRRNVAKGVNYDLSPQGDVFGWTGQSDTPPTGGTEQSPTAKQAVSIYSEPARSLIAQRKEIFMQSPITMNRIRTAIGTGTDLFNNVGYTAKENIKKAFGDRFNINPESYLSYPLWTYKESPTLLHTLESKNTPSTYWSRTGTTNYNTILKNYFTITEWGIDFSTLGWQTRADIWSKDVDIFFNNAAQQIKNIEYAVEIEAIEYLRKPQNGGYRFLEYGDQNV